jgi:methylmalonyl-CoA mutase N-terminal domain/subunit
VGGAWAIEKRTRDIEEQAREIIAGIDAAGGTLAAIEAGRLQRQVQDAAYETQQAIDRGDQIIVGVNRYNEDAEEGPEGTGRRRTETIKLLQIDPEGEKRQAEAVAAVRRDRDAAAWRGAIAAIESAASGGGNLMPPVLAAVEARATLGEIADALRRTFGEYRDANI